MSSSNATFEFGSWNATSQTFTASANTPSAIRLTTFNNNQPLFFGRVLGRNTFNTGAQSVATYQPREISLVLDYSASMAYDSQFRNISLLGQTAVEANLQQIYTQLGSPTYGSLTYTPVLYGTTSSTNTTIKSHFGLTSLAYPYPGGSWDEYIDYVQTDSYVNSAGYRCKYGYLTWVNYLVAKRYTNSDTPALKNCSEQPVTALKDAVDSFLAFLGTNSANDRVAVSVYTYSDNTAKLEQGLTHTYTAISTICRGRQAGHYIAGTNISAGMTKGRLELQNNSRIGASRLLVVMTDGVVNLPSGNTTSDKNAVLAEATLCQCQDPRGHHLRWCSGGYGPYAAGCGRDRGRRLRRSRRSADCQRAGPTRRGLCASRVLPAAATGAIGHVFHRNADTGQVIDLSLFFFRDGQLIDSGIGTPQTGCMTSPTVFPVQARRAFLARSGLGLAHLPWGRSCKNPVWQLVRQRVHNPVVS